MAGAKAVAAVEEEVEAVAEEEAEVVEEEATVVVAAVAKAVAAVVVVAAALVVAARVAEAEAEAVTSPPYPSCCPRIPRTTRGSHQTRARHQWRKLNRHGPRPQRAESASTRGRSTTACRPISKLEVAQIPNFEACAGCFVCMCESILPGTARNHSPKIAASNLHSHFTVSRSLARSHPVQKPHKDDRTMHRTGTPPQRTPQQTPPMSQRTPQQIHVMQQMQQQQQMMMHQRGMPPPPQMQQQQQGFRGMPPPPQPPSSKDAAPITNYTKVPLAAMPPDVRAALAKSWDKEGKGYVTVGELTAGAHGELSARNARQARQISNMNSIQPTGAPSAFAGAASMPTGSTGRGTQGSGQYTEMPGDFALLDSVGLAEGQGIWERMAALIRRQRLDVRILLDAHDRKNQGKVDMDTFRRALCYAFGNVWIELAMTSAEFNQITKPYLTRTPNNPGEPEGFVAWQKFATDLQTLADKRTHSDTFMQQLTKVEARERVEADLMKNYGVTVYELKKTFRDLKNVLMLKAGSSSHLVTAAFRNMDRDHTGKIGSAEIKKYLDTAQRGNEKISAKVMDCIVDLCDNDGDGEVDYNELSHMILCDDIIELLALVPDKTKKCGQQMKDSQIIGWRNVTAKELQEAQKAIKERMMIKYKDIHTGLRKIDTKGDGILSRDEIKAMLQTLELLKHVNYHTGAVHGSITPACADTLIDYVDKNGDGKISYQEFHRVLTAENILVIPPPRNPAARFGSGKFA